MQTILANRPCSLVMYTEQESATAYPQEAVSFQLEAVIGAMQSCVELVTFDFERASLKRDDRSWSRTLTLTLPEATLEARLSLQRSGACFPAEAHLHYIRASAWCSHRRQMLPRVLKLQQVSVQLLSLVLEKNGTTRLRRLPCSTNRHSSVSTSLCLSGGEVLQAAADFARYLPSTVHVPSAPLSYSHGFRPKTHLTAATTCHTALERTKSAMTHKDTIAGQVKWP